MTDTELRISEEVAAATEVVEDYTPPSGADVRVKVFHGSAAFNVNCVCKLIWKYGEAGEKLLWTIKGEGNAPLEFVIPSAEVNGTSKLAITCENGGSGAVYMSAYAFIGSSI